MIRYLSLDRFKAFREERIYFAPLTIVAGQNSSGKSTIIQALNAILQSAQGRVFPLDIVLNGDKAHLGGFKNVVHGHDARHSFGVGINFSIGENDFSLSAIFKQSGEEGHLFPRQVKASSSSFGEFSFDWNQRVQNFHVVLNPNSDLVQRQKRKYFSGFRTLLMSGDAEKRQSVMETLGVQDPSQVEEAMDALYQEAATESRNGRAYNVSNFSEALSAASNNPFFEVLMREASDGVRQLRARCGYVGPMRASPARYFPLGGGDLSADASGEGTSKTLARWKDRKSSLVGEVRSSLAQLELASDLTISVEHDEFLKVGIKPHGRVFTDSIADVGYGVSQVLPMIVADLNLPAGGTLLINQPEIHLHPSSQALLGNYFASRLKSRQYIVETHSEYLINRIRLLVARGELNSEDVRVIYCAADGKGASVAHEIRIEADGSLSGAPKEFFSTYAADAFGIAMAVIDNDIDDNHGDDDASE